ncbi:MAG: NADP(H)-dependent aldo-keto reductase [Polaribacter sp.]|nr:NADP(H)-dependent aldo-keto reductase [Polaribacter sp.]
MKYTTLPNTNLKVSKICLGTMTFGEQNTEADGHEQLDYALEEGVNFIDTAEMYSVPARPETYGATEKIIGSWLKKTGNRNKIVLASKIAGPGEYTAHIRKDGYCKRALKEAIENSLQRLQTDYLDVYQLHWPERQTNYFGVRDYTHNSEDVWQDNFKEVLETLDQIKQEGKIRHIGVSNETTWGTKRFLEESEKNNLPRLSTIQNPYSLLCRTFDSSLAELSMRENVGLLAYSPLGFGVLSGKYIRKENVEKARITLFPRFSRYSSEQAVKATKLYLALAEKNNLSLTQMSLAWVNQQPWVTSNIIGATNLTQLKENIESIHVALSEEVLKEIDAIHNLIPNPAP